VGQVVGRTWRLLHTGDSRRGAPVEAGAGAPRAEMSRARVIHRLTAPALTPQAAAIWR
jgi:hypothetical protein